MSETKTGFPWLIEAPGLQYLSVQKIGVEQFRWTTDHDKAIRFISEVQADAVLSALRALDRELHLERNPGNLSWGTLFAFEPTLGNATAVEHGWLP